MVQIKFHLNTNVRIEVLNVQFEGNNLRTKKSHLSQTPPFPSSLVLIFDPKSANDEFRNNFPKSFSVLPAFESDLRMVVARLRRVTSS